MPLKLKAMVREWILPIKPINSSTLANDGTFARSNQIPHIIVTDIDANAVNRNYLQAQQNNESNMLTFVVGCVATRAGNRI